MAGRLRPLLADEINLVAYHLPLDAHPAAGNNALIADALGLTDRHRFAEHGGQPLGIAGTLPGDGLLPAALVARVTALCQPPVAFLDGPPRVRTVGIVSGGGADDIHEAAALGLDAFITGEPEERSQSAAREEGIHFLAAGHHATERFGVRQLGELLAERFGIEHRFVDVENPV
jgi:dinuclear metal center YbgI/SA1388 family protein